MHHSFLHRRTLFDQRTLVHLLFWAATILFFAMVFHHQPESYLHSIRIFLAYLPGFVFFTYLLLYYYVPQFIFKRNLIAAVLWFIILVFIPLFYFKLTDLYILHSTDRFSVADLETAPKSMLAIFFTGGLALSVKLVRNRPINLSVQQDLFLRADRKMVKVLLDEILYVESMKDYVKIHSKDKKCLIVKKTMHEMEDLLPRNLFMRIHRSFIVAIHQITAFTPSDVEINGLQIPVGKFYRKELERLSKGITPR